MKIDSKGLTTVQFKTHKLGYSVSGIVSISLGVMFYFSVRPESNTIALFLLIAGLLLSIYCFFNAVSNAVILELSIKGIRHKKHFYKWDDVECYAIIEENSDDASFNYLILNLKTVEAPYAIQLDWIDDQESVKNHMAAFAKAFEIEFEG